VAQEGDVTQPPSAHEQEDQHQPHQRHESVVPGEPEAGELLADLVIEADAPQVAAEDLKTSVGGQGLAGELHPQIAVDAEGEKAFCLSHWKWAFLSCFGLREHNRKSRKGAHFQFLSPRRLTEVLTDQG